MAYAQTQFDSFHNTILFGYESSKELRERREALLCDLKNNISADAPAYETFYQGSYALDTGVTPLDGNPDMDIGIIFDCAPEDYSDPLKLKNFVRDALVRHNRTVDIRRPCVTVTYYRDNVATHHIDMAVYSINGNNQTNIAWCRESTPLEEREWVVSEARELTKKITDRFDGTDRSQFRRAVRALKRWRDEHIGHKNTPSIGLTVAAHKWFSPRYDATDGKARDLIAIRDLIQQMLNNWGGRLTVNLPVAPYSDLFERMSDKQMTSFKTSLEALRDGLNEAEQQPDTHEACKILRKQFGEDFPVPEKVDTTKQTSAGLSVSGRSA